jgi:hypothetical protein
MKAKPFTLTPEAAELLRQAASYGPGLRGKRAEGSDSERAVLRDQFSTLGIDPPPFLDRVQTWVDRRAKLFEAGDYPDKGVTVSTEALQHLAQTFDLPVPVLIEHAKSPLQIGYLTDVRAEGVELFGTVALTKEANELIEASGAHALSLGLSPDLGSIKEVSLVKTPRVPSARLFTGEVFSQETDWKAEFEKLRDNLEVQEGVTRIDGLLAEGRLVPAQVPFAKALVAAGTAVEFDGGSVPVGRLVLSLLENAPKHRLFSEFAPAGQISGPGFEPDEKAFYDRYFAGLSLADIARHRSPNT